jgi:hypothetical protein
MYDNSEGVSMVRVNSKKLSSVLEWIRDEGIESTEADIAADLRDAREALKRIKRDTSYGSRSSDCGICLLMHAVAIRALEGCE